jgi:hypothetical protein
MKKLIALLLIAIALIFAPLAFAGEVHCPEHGYATCRDTYETKMAEDGGMLHKYSCTCGDEWWIRVN